MKWSYGQERSIGTMTAWCDDVMLCARPQAYGGGGEQSYAARSGTRPSARY